MMTQNTPPLSDHRRRAVRSMLEREVFDTARADRDRRTTRRTVLLVGAAAALTVALVLGPLTPGGSTRTTGPAIAAAGVRLTPEGDAVIAEITDPEASAAAMTAAFREKDIDITVTLVPAAPALVGTVVMTAASDWANGSDITDAGTRPGCFTAGGGPCVTAVRIPAGFTGQGEIAIGRAPERGERIVAEQ